MPHTYEDGPCMAVSDDPLTGTKSGDCIPGCIRVDSSRYPHTPLLRVPVYWHKRAGCQTVTELFDLVQEVCGG